MGATAAAAVVGRKGRFFTRLLPATTAVIVRSHYQYHGPGRAPVTDDLIEYWKHRDFFHRGFTVGIGGPVGSGKTATTLALCRILSGGVGVGAGNSNYEHLSLPPLLPAVGVVTNDIFTQEDAEFLIRNKALPSARHIKAVETGGCPHAAIREDISANLTALEQLTRQLLLLPSPDQRDDNHTNDENHDKKKNNNNKDEAVSRPLSPPLLICESGGDNLAANFSRELADLILYVIDVAGGDKVPRKGGPGITQSDLLIINKVDLAEAVGADLHLMEHQAQHMRRRQRPMKTTIMNQSSKGEGDDHDHDDYSFAPVVMASIKQGRGVSEIVDFIVTHYQKAIQLSPSSLTR